MITFAVESYHDYRAEQEPLLALHWREVAIHQDAIPLDPDVDAYRAMQDAGQLCSIIARHEGRIVGYYVSIVRPHLHYRTTLHAFTDVYYLLPEYRDGTGAGIRMIKEAMKVWKQRGVKKAFTATKTHLDMSKVLVRLGWERTENTFCILL